MSRQQSRADSQLTTAIPQRESFWQSTVYPVWSRTRIGRLPTRPTKFSAAFFNFVFSSSWNFGQMSPLSHIRVLGIGSAGARRTLVRCFACKRTRGCSLCRAVVPMERSEPTELADSRNYVVQKLALTYTQKSPSQVSYSRPVVKSAFSVES